MPPVAALRIALLLLSGLPPCSRSAPQSIPADTTSQSLSMDTASLSSGPYSQATALLEKTLFRIDVARLRLRFGSETADALESLLAGGEASEERTRAAVALAAQSRDAWAGLSFLWGTDFRRFLEGIRDGVETAFAAGLLDASFAQRLSDSLPAWYSSLEERGIRDGDLMMYRIQGDTLRTVFVTVDGQVLVDHTDVGPQARLAVLGGFLEPGSDFRAGLLSSLLDPGEDTR